MTNPSLMKEFLQDQVSYEKGEFLYHVDNVIMRIPLWYIIIFESDDQKKCNHGKRGWS